VRVLFIGGTGIISTACTQLAAESGIDLTLVTRGMRPVKVPPHVRALTLDIHDQLAARVRFEGVSFDAVVDWIAFTPTDIERDLALFRDKTRQFVFISSASVYQKPVTHYLVTESTPLANPFWDYSQSKIACEERLMRAYRQDGFPVTIIRPSLTYGETQIPLAINAWGRSYTAVDRMLKGKKVIVPGDGSSLWVITHNTDFAKGLVGLLGNEQAIGHAFHITSDEVLSWDQIYRAVGAAAGVEPRLVHISSDYICACLPSMTGTLLGDKAVSVVFDNSKIKRFVPGFVATSTFARGIRRTIEWFRADPARQVIDPEADAVWDRLIASYEKGLNDAISRE